MLPSPSSVLLSPTLCWKMRRIGGQRYILSMYVSLSGEALVLCSSGGQLITLVWGLVTGHHQPALCCCQEPFTPSISSANGTSESIKTIITANPTESKGNYFRWSRKTWLRCLNLSVQRVTWCALSQTACYSLNLLYLSSVNTLMIAAGFSSAIQRHQWSRNEPAIVWACRSCILISLGGLGQLFCGK